MCILNNDVLEIDIEIHNPGTELQYFSETVDEALPLETKYVCLTSDSCGGQNRNRYIAALLLYAVNTLPIEEINLKFLETGHTEMEVDCIHSLIERAKKGISIHSPLEWPTVIKSASKKYPLIIKNLSCMDMIDLKVLKQNLLPYGNLDVDTENKKIWWLKIKSLKFTSNKILIYI